MTGRHHNAEGADLRAVTVDEIATLHKLYKSVIECEADTFREYVGESGLETDLELRRALTLLSIYLVSKSFPRWQIFHRWPPESMRLQIIEEITDGVFLDQINLEYPRKYLMGLGGGQPHSPIDTSLTGTLGYVVLGATCLSHQVRYRNCERLFGYLMRRFRRRVRFRNDFPEAPG